MDKRNVCFFFLAVMLLAAPLSAFSEQNADAQATELQICDFAGNWRVIVTRNGRTNYCSEYCYVFDKSGKWSRIDDGETEVKTQGQLVLNDGKLMLLPNPPETEGKESKEIISIPVESASNSVIVLAGGIQPELKLRLERITVPSVPLSDLIGVWRFKQTSLITDETRESPFELDLKADGSFLARPRSGEKKDDTLPSGSWFWRDGKLQLKVSTSTPSSNFWQNPVFFLCNGQLILNRLDVFVAGTRELTTLDGK